MPALFLTPGHLFRPLPSLYFSRPPYFFARALAYKADFFRLARHRRKKRRGGEHYVRAGAGIFLYAPLFLHRSGRVFYTGAERFFWTLTRRLTHFARFLHIFGPYISVFLHIFGPIYTHLSLYLCTYLHTYLHI